ncbi:hypothetical protein [Yoonia sp. 2307UL14-13]|uniref:hypothetical protein n=1 Tax=Yoonia sp. 2307UL14-13 TaxID=3126506 RepID=UPI003094EC28
MMTITSGEWVLLGLAGIALVHTAYTCMSLRRDVVQADERQPFRGLTAALSDVPKRTQLKAAKSA